VRVDDSRTKRTPSPPLSRYKFRPGDLVITSDYHEQSGYQGVLMDRFQRHGTWVWRIHWFNGPPFGAGKKDTECEINLYNLRRRYHYYNKEGEYYESKH
jgi:hypothetical protein